MDRINDEIKNIISNKYTYDKVTKIKLLEVLFLINNLLLKYNLRDTRVEFREHHGALGKCVNNGEIISIQINHAINDDMNEIKNTILHEIAHALVGNEYGHNIVWQNKAKELGVTGVERYRK
jgi:hypothetical protein